MTPAVAFIEFVAQLLGFDGPITLCEPKTNKQLPKDAVRRLKGLPLEF